MVRDTQNPLREELIGRSIEAARLFTDLYEKKLPPFLLHPLLKHFGIASVRMRALDRDARLIVDSERLVVEVSSISPKVRRRVSVGHEIGHLILEKCKGDLKIPDGHAEPWIESLCDRLAGELLAPDWAVRKWFESLAELGQWQEPIRCSTVLQAASLFEVSVDVMAGRIFHDIPLDREKIAIIWRFQRNTSNRSSKKALRIASAWHSRCDAGFIPLNLTAQKTSVIQKAFEQPGTFRGQEHFSFRRSGDFVVEAAGFDWLPFKNESARERAVLSLLAPKP